MKFFSGGARGADALWFENLLQGCEAQDIPVHFTIMSFQGHKPALSLQRKQKAHVCVMTPKQAELAKVALQDCNLILKRNVTRLSPYSRSLLLRNMLIAQSASVLFCVGKLQSGKVQGGSAWATTAATRGKNGKHNAVFFFDMNSAQWKEWSFTTNAWQPTAIDEAVQRHCCEDTSIAVIGSRDLTEDGITAIRHVSKVLCEIMAKSGCTHGAAAGKVHAGKRVAEASHALDSKVARMSFE